MAVQFSSNIVDRCIAPGVSSFTHADIPDMSTWAAESPYWIANFFLNSVCTATFKPPMNAYAFNFLRRAQAAFSQHQLARESTLAFLRSGGQSVTCYAEALFHWETFLGQSWHAYKLLETAFQGKIFKKGNGSVEERLNKLYNEMKHVESCIENTTTTSNKQMPSGATVPVWLENTGIRSLDASMTYAETGEVLKQLAA
jgi:hypothetical protein